MTPHRGEATCPLPAWAAILLCLVQVDATAWAGDCPPAIDTAALGRAVGQAEVALMDVDEESFHDRVATAVATLPCLDEPLTPPLAARYHRLLALHAFSRGDDVTAYREFAALVTVEPGRDLPVEFAPPGHPARALFDRARAGDWTATKTASPPTSGALWIDGTRSTAFPSRRPYLFQYVPPGGQPTVTALVAVGASPPSYPVPTAARRGRAAKVGLLAVAGVAAAGSGVLYAHAGWHHRTFWSDETDYWSIYPHRAGANREVAGAAGLLAVAVGTGAAGLLVAR